MRQIKFRAWDVKYKQWLKGGYPYGSDARYSISPFSGKFQILNASYDYDSGVDIQAKEPDVILEQFTGLCDGTKWEDLTEAERESWVRQGNYPSEWHGKEIYEGDIVENINMKYKEHKNAVVEWAGHRYILLCLCGVVFNHGFENISISEIKVIGNIHEEVKI